MHSVGLGRCRPQRHPGSPPRRPGTPISRLALGFDAMPEARLAVVVEKALSDLKRGAHYTTKADGGKRAARELVEIILKSKDIWEEMIDKARS